MGPYSKTDIFFSLYINTFRAFKADPTITTYSESYRGAGWDIDQAFNAIRGARDRRPDLIEVGDLSLVGFINPHQGQVKTVVVSVKNIPLFLAEGHTMFATAPNITWSTLSDVKSFRPLGMEDEGLKVYELVAKYSSHLSIPMGTNLSEAAFHGSVMVSRHSKSALFGLAQKAANKSAAMLTFLFREGAIKDIIGSKGSPSALHMVLDITAMEASAKYQAYVKGSTRASIPSPKKNLAKEKRAALSALNHLAIDSLRHVNSFPVKFELEGFPAQGQRFIDWYNRRDSTALSSYSEEYWQAYLVELSLQLADIQMHIKEAEKITALKGDMNIEDFIRLKILDQMDEDAPLHMVAMEPGSNHRINWISSLEDKPELAAYVAAYGSADLRAKIQTQGDKDEAAD